MAETKKTFTLRAIMQVALIVFVSPLIPMLGNKPFQEELLEYKEYARRTRFRLIPCVW